MVRRPNTSERWYTPCGDKPFVAMEQSAGHVVQLRVRLRAPIWHLGAGWAALGGAIASGVLGERDAPLLVRVGVLLLVWLLADPVMGTLWELGTSPHGVWTQLWRAVGNRDQGAPLILLPYTQIGSPAWQLANWLGRRRVWWRTAFWPQSGEAFITICSLLPVALITGALLNPAVLTLVCVAVVLAWLATLWQGRMSIHTRHYPWRLTVASAWSQFGIPWMIGCAATGISSWLGVILGVCLTFSYMGLLRQPTWQPAVLAGPLAGLVIVLSLRQVLVAAVILVLLIAYGGLLFSRRPDEAPCAQFLSGLHLFGLGIMLIVSFTVGL